MPRTTPTATPFRRLSLTLPCNQADGDRRPVASSRYRLVVGWVVLFGAALPILGLSSHPVLAETNPAQAAVSTGTAALHFQRDVMPILAEHCLLCHGPDEQAGGLRLDQAEGMATVVSAGDWEQSELLERLRTDDEDLRMPAGKDPLPEEEIRILERWVREGAEWPSGAGHWAFRTPQRPPLPNVANPAWVQEPIDYFVLEQLEARGQAPSPPASGETLIRRLHLDLLGLPPSPEVIDEFLADGDPGRVDRWIDRLMASPHYGERWALRWLDLTRYGDTDGYDYDRVRPGWPYREWVIAALNGDLPYDQFIVEQLAGDLLPDARDDQRIATGFIRNSPVPQYRFDSMVDRVATMGTALLGLTLECAQCHNHKFDPVTQLEFYRLMAVFNNAEDRVEELRAPISGEVTKALVVAEKVKPAETFVALGGSFLNPGERAWPGTLAAFHDPREDQSFTRLTLAEWMVDERNPLVARVMVNRQWEALFGQALVPTSEDLGSRTARPTHPDLLDWLAVEFRESGWSLKQLHRMILNSATYQQSSVRTAASGESDPQNQWLGRGGRFRLDAELIRDVALSAAGVLEPSIGGPSVFPPQPHGISENRFRGAMEWKTSEQGDRYRRGLYTFWKRSALHPAMGLFDAPRREDSCPRRGRSNSPLQALVTLNEPAYFEAAVLLGHRMWRHDSENSDPSEKLRHGFRICTSRWPTSQELELLRNFHEAEHQRFLEDPEAAQELVSAVAHPESMGLEPDRIADLPGWAACAMVANVLLSLDETISRP
jgi:mono/diheme cytochrome c family protein